VMFDHDSLIISYDVDRGEPRGNRSRKVDPEAAGLGSCIDCHKCVSVCPTGIDIRDGLQYQCIGCAACVDACTDVMETMGYGESLVRYSTQRRDEGQSRHWLRPRLVGYASLILVMCGVFAYSVTHRVPVAFDIARDRNRLYREFWDGSVENVYTLRVSNRAAVDREYSISFESSLPLVYDGPETIHVVGGTLGSVAVRLTLPGDESASTTSGDVQFEIAPLDDPTIRVEKESRFHMPAEVDR
jgi:cytochrome c oxidase accessory protein FixG